jgi:hypothetical protein
MFRRFYLSADYESIGLSPKDEAPQRERQIPGAHMDFT